MKEKELDKYLGQKVEILFRNETYRWRGTLNIYKRGFLGIGKVYTISDLACWCCFKNYEVKKIRKIA